MYFLPNTVCVLILYSNTLATLLAKYLLLYFL